MIRIFVGFDQREAVCYHAFCQSVIDTCSVPVSFTPLTGIQDQGTNAFNVARFLVPSLCDFKGRAIYADSDMIVKSDLAELWDLAGFHAVQVVKHDYKSKHPKKYQGSLLEAPNRDYSRKNWSSLILWDCANGRNRVLNADYVQAEGSKLHSFGWLHDEWIGSLDPEWNWLVNEYEDNPQAKILHYTVGSPCFKAYENGPHSTDWHKTYQRLSEAS